MPSIVHVTVERASGVTTVGRTAIGGIKGGQAAPDYDLSRREAAPGEGCCRLVRETDSCQLKLNSDEPRCATTESSHERSEQDSTVRLLHGPWWPADRP